MKLRHKIKEIYMTIVKTFAPKKASRRDIIATKNIANRKASPIGKTSICMKANTGRHINETTDRKKK